MAARPAKVITPFDEISYRVIGAAMAVHNELGPGFSEELYQRAMAVSLAEAKLAVEREAAVDVCFHGLVLGHFELDFPVEGCLIVETKALSELARVHEQQVISYLAASGLSLGLLINFGAARLEYRRIFPPKAVQQSPAYEGRQRQRQKNSG